jgi:hypothetical protein
MTPERHSVEAPAGMHSLTPLLNDVTMYLTVWETCSCKDEEGEADLRCTHAADYRTARAKLDFGIRSLETDAARLDVLESLIRRNRLGIQTETSHRRIVNVLNGDGSGRGEMFATLRWAADFAASRPESADE